MNHIEEITKIIAQHDEIKLIAQKSLFYAIKLSEYKQENNIDSYLYNEMNDGEDVFLELGDNVIENLKTRTSLPSIIRSTINLMERIMNKKEFIETNLQLLLFSALLQTQKCDERIQNMLEKREYKCFFDSLDFAQLLVEYFDDKNAKSTKKRSLNE